MILIAGEDGEGQDGLRGIIGDKPIDCTVDCYVTEAGEHVFVQSATLGSVSDRYCILSNGHDAIPRLGCRFGCAVTKSDMDVVEIVEQFCQIALSTWRQFNLHLCVL